MNVDVFVLKNHIFSIYFKKTEIKKQVGTIKNQEGDF